MDLGIDQRAMGIDDNPTATPKNDISDRNPVNWRGDTDREREVGPFGARS